MVRKRAAYLRIRDRFRRRRRGPPPKDGWLLPDLAKLAGVTVRTVRYYLEKELLPKPVFRGTATRYDRKALLRLLAIQRMQRHEHLPLAAIKKRLAHFSDAELETYATERLTSGPVATALGVVRPPPAVAVTLGEPESPPKYVSYKWEHIQLLPGLWLFVVADAPPLLRRLAGQIYEHCVGAAGAPPAGR